MIDPQLQGIKWIKTREGDHLQIVQLEGTVREKLVGLLEYFTNDRTLAVFVHTIS